MTGRTLYSFVTFGDGAPSIRRAADRVKSEALRSGHFRDSRAFGLRSLRELDEMSVQRNLSVLNPTVRGFGFWIWKPILISAILRSTSSDFVTYADAGCVVNGSPAAGSRLRDYQDIAAEQGVCLMETAHPEASYSKADLLSHYGLAPELHESPQRTATILVFRAKAATADFVHEWLAACEIDNHRLLDDSVSVGSPETRLIDHRHDQSILSVLSKTRGLTALPDETYHPGSWAESGAGVPIWAARHRLGSPHPAVRRAPIRTRFEMIRNRAAAIQMPLGLTTAERARGKSGSPTT